MLSLYCQECGRPNMYGLNKPIYCGFCGASLNVAHSTVKKNPPQEKKTEKKLEASITSRRQDARNFDYIKRRRIEEEYDLDEEDEIEAEVPEIDNIEIEPLVRENVHKGVKLETIAQQSKTGFSRPKPKKQSKKQVLERFKQEAGGAAQPISID